MNLHNWSANKVSKMLRLRVPPFHLFFVLVPLLAATESVAASAFLLPYPNADSFGTFTAATYDDAGRRVGDASIRIEHLENGHVRLQLRSGFDGGARNELEAVLEPAASADAQGLRILRERSQSFDPDGKALVILTIDHEKGEARCTPPEAEGGEASVLTLPSPDRVVNVPLSLLFQPLGEGVVETVETQAFFCLGGARMMGFMGRLAEEDEPGGLDPDGRRIREVRYRPDGKSFFSWAAKALAPKISFWIDVNNRGAYVAHRMPLYSKGPVVYVILDGIEPSSVIKR
jgi:hypothetical protein